MKNKICNPLSIVLFGMTCLTVSWFGRGIVDKLFMMEGRFHIVNGTDEPHKVTLQLPNGSSMDLALELGSIDVNVPQTGEGSLSINVDDQPARKVGYVTSRNGIVVLFIEEETIGFSQIFP